MTNSELFSERHQPNSLDECILEAFPDHIQKQFRYLEKAEKLPNLLLFGIAGTGKSTIARILSNTDKYSVYMIEGSMFNKESLPKLQSFISTNSLFSQQKVVFIDEADGMTLPAQYALRSFIDPKYSASWLMTCNFKKKLIEPITSRFMQVECSLPPANKRDAHIAGVVRRMRQILEVERIHDVSDEELSAIASAKYPDIRQTINEMQMHYSFLAEAA